MVRRRMELGTVAALLAWMSLLVSGCATVGRDFPTDRVVDIRMDDTTQEQVREMFGDPWRVGIEDGRTTWTYGKYRYRLFGEDSTTDLVVRFNQAGRVVSYSFSTTEHQEENAD